MGREDVRTSHGVSALLSEPFSHVRGLLVVVDVVDVSGQTEVGDLHHVIFCDENVPGCQVSVDTLNTTES